MISDGLTNAASNGSVPDIIYAFDSALGNFFLMASLFAMLIVLGMSMFAWSKDFLASFLQASFLTTVVAFLFSLARTSFGEQLLGFEKVMVFIVITALIFVGKRIGE